MMRALAAAVGVVLLGSAWPVSAAEQAAPRWPAVQVTAVGLVPGIGTQRARVGPMTNDFEPDGMVVSPNGRHVYVLNTGAQKITEVPSDFAASGIRSIHVPYPPTSAAITPNGRLLYVTIWGSPRPAAEPGSVAVIRTSDFRIIKYIEIPWASNIVMAPNGKTAYVTSWNDGRSRQSVTPIRTSTNTAGGAIPVAGWHYLPIRVAITPDGRYLYILSRYTQPGGTRDTGLLTAIRTATRKVRKQFNVGSAPLALAITPDSKHVYVTSEPGLTAISIAADTARRVNVGPYPGGLAITPDSKIVYVANSLNQIVPVNARSDTAGPAITIDLPDLVNGNDGTMVISPDTKTLYVLLDDFNNKPGTVVAINTATNLLAAPIGVEPNPIRIVLSPDGRTAYVLGYS